MLIGFGLEGRSASDPGETDRLMKAGCDRVYLTARHATFPARLLEVLRPGDSLIVTDLARLGASLRDVVLAVERLHKAGVAVRAIDGDTMQNPELANHLGAVCALLAELCRKLDRREGGRPRKPQKGRPPALTSEEQARARRLLENNSVREVAAALGVSVPTLYRYFPRRGAHGPAVRRAGAGIPSVGISKEKA